MRLPSSCAHVPPRPQNFDQGVNGNQYVLVDFYAPWCSRCKALAPQYAAAAAYLAYLQQRVLPGNNSVLAKVDAVSTPEGETLADRFNVTSYPTLIWFVNGQPQPYNASMDDLSVSDIVFWVVSQTDVITRALTEQVLPPGPET